MQRRLALKAGLGAMMAAPLRSFAANNADDAEALRTLKHQFIVDAMKEATTPPPVVIDSTEPRVSGVMVVSTLVPFADWDFYYVKGGSIGWGPEPPPAPEGMLALRTLEVVVPEGFVTDLASVPRAFWQLKRPEGRHAYAAVIHDYLYWTQTKPRKECDDILRQALLESKADKATVWAFYEAVRKFGGSAWKKNQKLKAAGERRFLKIQPSDFTTSWSEWKVHPGALSESPT